MKEGDFLLCFCCVGFCFEDMSINMYSCLRISMIVNVLSTCFNFYHDAVLNSQIMLWNNLISAACLPCNMQEIRRDQSSHELSVARTVSYSYKFRSKVHNQKPIYEQLKSRICKSYKGEYISYCIQKAKCQC